MPDRRSLVCVLLTHAKCVLVSIDTVLSFPYLIAEADLDIHNTCLFMSCNLPHFISNLKLFVVFITQTTNICTLWYDPLWYVSGTAELFFKMKHVLFKILRCFKHHLSCSPFKIPINLYSWYRNLLNICHICHPLLTHSRRITIWIPNVAIFNFTLPRMLSDIIV